MATNVPVQHDEDLDDIRWDNQDGSEGDDEPGQTRGHRKRSREEKPRHQEGKAAKKSIHSRLVLNHSAAKDDPKPRDGTVLFCSVCPPGTSPRTFNHVSMCISHSRHDYEMVMQMI